MANDLWVNTAPLWGGDVSPGDRNVVVAQFQMIGTKSLPTSLTFESEIGPDMKNVVGRSALVADLYATDARGRRTFGSDGHFETQISKGSMSPDGDLYFRFGGIGTILAQRGIDLQVQVDVLPFAEDGMPFAFDVPTVGFMHPRHSAIVRHIGSSNPLYVVNGSQEVSLGFDLSSPAHETFSPGDEDVTLATMNVTTDDYAYIDNVYVAIEGRHADGSLIRDVDRALEDFRLRNPLTGQVWFATPAGEVNGLEILKFQGIYVDGSTSLEVNVDQDGIVTDGDKFRVHWVTQTSESGRPVNIGGLTGLTDAYLMEADAGDWNDRVVVTPEGVLSGNFVSVNIPQLNVAVKSIGTFDTAVKNEDDILLLRFEARADGEDLLFNNVSFVAEVGSLLNVQDATLWFDSDNNGLVDTIAQPGVSVVGGQFRFDNIIGGGILIPNEETVLMELHADVASSLTTNTLRVGMVPGSIEVEEADNGSSLAPSQIVVTTVPSKTWTLVNQGDLFVTLDSTPVRSRQLLGGVLSETAFRLQFRAQNEDVDITDLQFTTRGSMGSSIDRIELFKDGMTTAFATATISGCGSDQVPTMDNGVRVQTFCMNTENGQLVIPDGVNLDVLARLRMKSDEQGALSGESFQLFLGAAAVSDNSTGQGAVRARGRQSSSNLAANDGDALAEGEVFIGTDTAAPNREIVSNRHTVVLSKFTNFTNANPDADNTNVPTGISPFAQFKITTATHANTLYGLNRAALDSFVIYVNATNVSMDASAFKLYNKADSSTKVSVVAESLAGVPLTGQVTGNFRIRVTNLAASAVDAVFESGETSTLVLEGNILNSNVTPSLSSGLQGSLDLTDQFFSWFDRDALTNKRFNGVEYSDTVVRSTNYRS